MVVVTGISGFVASHIAVQLLEAGYHVRGTVRDPARSEPTRRAILAAARVPEHALEFAQADLTEDAGWQAAVAGARFVVHTASPLPVETPHDEDELIVPAREGTLRVLRAAAAASVERVVLTSSIAAMIGDRSASATPIGAETWTDPEAPRLRAYVRSKTLAERAAWDFVRSTPGAPELVTINPGAIIGPVIVPRLGTSNRIVEQVLAGGLPALPRVGFEVVDVRDVAQAHLLAITSEAAAGRRFPVTTGFLWLRDVGLMLAARYPDRRLPTGELPDWLVRLFALFNPAVRAVADDIGVRIDVRSTDTMDALGWHPRPLLESVVDTAESLIAQGLIGR